MENKRDKESRYIQNIKILKFSSDIKRLISELPLIQKALISINSTHLTPLPPYFKNLSFRLNNLYSFCKEILLKRAPDYSTLNNVLSKISQNDLR